jgi:hypothetical protein
MRSTKFRIGLIAVILLVVLASLGVISSLAQTAEDPLLPDDWRVSLAVPSETLQPAISLEKTVGTDANVCASTSLIMVMPGTQVTYCYKVTNTGDLTLGVHDLQDSELGSVLSDFYYSLMPGASAFLTATVQITETTVNTATWTAYNPGPINLSTASDSATVEIFQPAISLEKTVGTDANACASTNQITVPPGTQVTYCYEVTNTGELALSLHDLKDSELGSMLSGFSYSLMPGASAFLTATVQITETTINMATWTAYNPGPTDETSAQAEARVVVPKPGIDLYLPFIRK